MLHTWPWVYQNFLVIMALARFCLGFKRVGAIYVNTHNVNAMTTDLCIW